jgi:GNAT superfamily N-acetyltransferase
MKSDRELIAAANKNYVASYRTLVEHCAGGAIMEVGGAFAFVTGLPLALFNGCVVVDPTTSTQLERAIDWVASRGLPHRVWLEESLALGLAAVPHSRGFERDERPYPAMALHPVPDPPEPPPGVTVARVNGSNLDEYIAVTVEAGIPRDAAARLFSASFAADPDVELFIGRLDGESVGTAVAIRSGDVSGIYAVGTVPAARRRGVGTALTWPTVAAGRAWGCDTAVLQASDMGFPIYSAMGFRTVVEYAVFGRPVQRGT